jgi:pimeloyl-ACP methyl ester carboxylesterase
MIALSHSEAERHPRGRFVLVDGVGHMVQQRRPLPTAKAILDLVTEVEAARA